jgi:PAT family beta-lactamase induction signal transducer AmpG
VSRWIMFALLYFAQGAAMAYFQNFQKPYLKSIGVPLVTIANLTRILMLPFILKMLFAFLSDRYSLFKMGHRKPYMVLGIGLASLAFFLCSWNLPSDVLWIFVVVIVTSSFGVALFDSTADGFAVETTQVHEQGIVQGAMVGGKSLGVILMSVIFGNLAQHYGYRYVFLLIAICVLIPLYFVLRIREAPRSKTAEVIRFQDFKDFFSLGLLVFIAYSIAYSFVSFGHDGIITLYLSDALKIPESQLGQFGAFRGFGSVVGAVLAGYLLTVANRWMVAYVSLVLIALGTFSSAYVLGPGNFLWMGAVWGAVWGFQETVFVTLAMSKASQKFPGASFALLMACSNIGTSLGDGWATEMSKTSFVQVFKYLGKLGLAVPLFLLAVQLSSGRKPKTRTAKAH